MGKLFAHSANLQKLQHVKVQELVITGAMIAERNLPLELEQYLNVHIFLSINGFMSCI
uniref:Uncharacterized protein n=1 Tax=Candidatus Kentrum sp. TC TaxID=2126339 RepID=A0A450ZAJ1_9GAMM|nr:MAG: hypothetical protein BECKTC1821D_GA0114238_108111 [Candidatus Kentron sp. TC]VFK50678.1 MAG: hypothetical protein BECKTC1821D_GA0114238_11174 [Candidatus Kentron sp. TC]